MGIDTYIVTFLLWGLLVAFAWLFAFLMGRFFKEKNFLADWDIAPAEGTQLVITLSSLFSIVFVSGVVLFLTEKFKPAALHFGSVGDLLFILTFMWYSAILVVILLLSIPPSFAVYRILRDIFL
jgi:hypothetical protein